MNTVFEIEKMEANNLPELQGLKEKQLQIVKENPFVEIVDSKTYEEAKKSRTTLVSARTEIEKQDKLIASKIKKFREMVSSASVELIAITKPHEDKQQDEVKRYEAIKGQEKLEKARLEEERKSKIKDSIDAIFKTALQKIENLSFELIETLKVDFEQNLYKTDVSQFEEFENIFNTKLNLLKGQFDYKVKILNDEEARRKEDERLKIEREKLEAEKKAEEQRVKAEREKFEKEQREAQEKLTAEQAKADAERKAKDDEAKKQREAEETKLQKERAELEAEKARLAKIESDRIEKEEAEKTSKLVEEKRIQDEKDAKAKAKAETERLEALKPEKQKAVEFLQSLQYSISDPEIKDEKLKSEFIRAMERIQDAISYSITEIKNFK